MASIDFTNVVLRSGSATPEHIWLYPLPVADVQSVVVYLYSGSASPEIVFLRDPTVNYEQSQATGSMSVTYIFLPLLGCG